MTDESSALIKGGQRFTKGTTGLSKETETDIAKMTGREKFNEELRRFDEDRRKFEAERQEYEMERDYGTPPSPGDVYGRASGPATVGGQEEDEEESKKALRGLFGSIIDKYFQGAPAMNAKKDFDAVLAQVFQPKGGAENFVNLRTPGQPAGKIPASPGVSGSSTGRAGRGTSTFPDDESGPHTESHQPYYSNPKDVPRGSGATTGMPRERALSQQYGSTAAVIQDVATKPGDTTERRRTRITPTSTDPYSAEDGGKTIAKAKSVVSWALETSHSGLAKGRTLGKVVDNRPGGLEYLIPLLGKEEAATDRTAWGRQAPGLGAGSSDRQPEGYLGEESETDLKRSEDDEERDRAFSEAERYEEEARRRDEAVKALKFTDKVKADSLAKQAVALRSKAMELRRPYETTLTF